MNAKTTEQPKKSTDPDKDDAAKSKPKPDDEEETDESTEEVRDHK